MSEFLYGIAGTMGFLGLVTATALGAANKSGQGATFRERILSSPSLSPLLIIHYFLPYGLVVLVLFMDLMSQLPQGVWSILIGGVAMLLNKAFGGSPDLPNDLCEIPGLKGLASKFMPQSLLFVSTIVTYLAAFVTVSSTSTFNAQTSTVADVSTAGKSGPVTVPELITSSGVTGVSPSPVVRIGASWGLAISVILIQLFGILSTPGCLIDPLSIAGFTLPPTARAILAVLIGMAAGGAGGWGMAGMSFTQPSYGVTGQQASQIILPGTTSTTQSRGPGFVREQFQLGSGLGEIPMASQGGQIPVDIAKSSGAVTPGESSDQFVCEAYKNGQLVTSTLVG
jgi:hypothetical protein